MTTTTVQEETHILYSDGRAVTVPFAPCGVTDQHTGPSRRPPGRDEMRPLADQARAWHHQWTDAQHGAIPGIVCHVSRARLEEKEDLAPSKDLLCLYFFFFLPSVIPASPWSIKGKAGHPTKGESIQHITPHS